jgi:hypothetical protein
MGFLPFPASESNVRLSFSLDYYGWARASLLFGEKIPMHLSCGGGATFNLYSHSLGTIGCRILLIGLPLKMYRAMLWANVYVWLKLWQEIAKRSFSRIGIMVFESLARQCSLLYLLKLH